MFLPRHGFFVKLASEWKAGRAMVVRVATVAFEGIEARPVDVQVQIANGNVVFTVVGLGDKAVACPASAPMRQIRRVEEGRISGSS